MYQNSYEEIGLIHKAPGSILDYYPCSMLFIQNDEIKGMIVYWKSNFGNKLGLSFGVNSQSMLNHVIPKMVELLSTQGYYTELSDDLELIVRSKQYNLPTAYEEMSDPSILANIVGVNEDMIFTNVDDPRREEYALKKFSGKKKPILAPLGSYLREIKGIGIIRKTLYGKPCYAGLIETTDSDCHIEPICKFF